MNFTPIPIAASVAEPFVNAEPLPLPEGVLPAAQLLLLDIKDIAKEIVNTAFDIIQPIIESGMTLDDALAGLGRLLVDAGAFEIIPDA